MLAAQSVSVVHSQMTIRCAFTLRTLTAPVLRRRLLEAALRSPAAERVSGAAAERPALGGVVELRGPDDAVRVPGRELRTLPRMPPPPFPSVAHRGCRRCRYRCRAGLKPHSNPLVGENGAPAQWLVHPELP
eukprot:TRINITY_DN15374_c0_g1_i2.p1 TRINITY_DN15374_c0_g1~~TRINITY_DN15374_c0_g1_i2.p1  ORF type:complete len:132 (-),score=4.68 TRINITY_DN15374_c0_g1_i2:188-583(-)